MNRILIGNIVALIASIFMVLSGVLKEKKKILYVQTVQMGLFVVSNIVLGGFTGAIINAINCVRNVLCYKDKLDLKWKILITILSVVFTMAFNTLGFIGILPLIITILYVWLMDVKDIIKFKVLIAVTVIMWLIYDLSIKSYTSAIFDFTTVVANIFTIALMLKGKKIKMDDVN